MTVLNNLKYFTYFEKLSFSPPEMDKNKLAFHMRIQSANIYINTLDLGIFRLSPT